MSAATSLTSRLRLGPADHGRRLSLDEYNSAEFEGEGLYELSRGALEVVQVPDEFPHGMIVHHLNMMLHEHHRTHPGQIHRIGSGPEFRLYLPSMLSDRHPDVAVALKATPPNPRGHRPPCLVMEVVSEGKEARERDLIIKRAEYLAYGLLEYWIVDPFERVILVLLRDGAEWVERAARDDQAASGLVLPGFMVRPADVWAAGTPED
jgi:Uma2 family endonuclease